jgi:hypothetical protein
LNCRKIIIERSNHGLTWFDVLDDDIEDEFYIIGLHDLEEEAIMA